MPKIIDRIRFIEEALRLDREGAPVESQAEAFGLTKHAFLRRMARYGYGRRTPRGYWARREEVEG